MASSIFSKWLICRSCKRDLQRTEGAEYCRKCIKNEEINQVRYFFRDIMINYGQACYFKNERTQKESINRLPGGYVLSLVHSDGMTKLKQFDTVIASYTAKNGESFYPGFQVMLDVFLKSGSA